jgi:hypothetical protein
VTDRHMGYIVILDKDLREDDAEQLITALQMVKGVREVVPYTSVASVAMLAEVRTRSELRERMLGAVLEVFGP